ncbi:MAG: UPF0234 protein [bacterium]|nr:MAG: UPF0234 protein [bacterium]
MALPSFDVVSQIDMAEVKNAVNQAMREMKQRYDFRGSVSNIELDEKKPSITLTSDDEVKMKSVVDVLQTRLIKRSVSLKSLDYGKLEPASGGSVRQVIMLVQGISTEKAREIVKIIKDTKIKVQAQIQDEQVRVSGKKKDDLQTVMTMLKEKDIGIDMQFVNYR